MEEEKKDLDLLFNKNCYYRSINFKNRKAKVKVFMHFNDLIEAITPENYEKIMLHIRKIRFYLYGYAGSFYNDTLPWGKDLLSKYDVEYEKLENQKYEIQNVADIPIEVLIRNYKKYDEHITESENAKNYLKSLRFVKTNRDFILNNYSIYYQNKYANEYVNQMKNRYGINMDSLERLAKIARTCVNDPKQDIKDHWVNLDPKGHEQYLIGKCIDIPVELITTIDVKDYSNIFIFTINNENYFIGFNTREIEE